MYLLQNNLGNKEHVMFNNITRKCAAELREKHFTNLNELTEMGHVQCEEVDEFNSKKDYKVRLMIVHHCACLSYVLFS